MEHIVIRSYDERRKWLASEVALFRVSTPATRVAAVIQLRRSFVWANLRTFSLSHAANMYYLQKQSNK